MSDGVIQGCKQSSCNVLSDRNCIEKHPLDDCPYLIHQFSTTSSSEEDQSNEAEAPNDVQFVPPVHPVSTHFNTYLGDELTARSAHSIMCANLTRVVALAGGHDCGKTSLLTCLYDHFQKRAHGEYLFAGSKTLMGFERRCFSSRLTSRRSTAVTERTQGVDEFRFLHLAVRRRDLNSLPQHLLFSDITGEAFNAARRTTDGAEKLALFRRADHFVLMVDGANISSSEFRHNEIQQTKTLMRALVQAKIITPKTIVDLVVNKWDLILNAPNTSGLQSSLDELRQELATRYAENMAWLNFYEIAALPETGVLIRGFGVDSLLKSWIETSALLQEADDDSNYEPFPPGQRRFISFHF